jgi:hypothetical protein
VAGFLNSEKYKKYCCDKSRELLSDCWLMGNDCCAIHVLQHCCTKIGGGFGGSKGKGEFCRREEGAVRENN